MKYFSLVVVLALVSYFYAGGVAERKYLLCLDSIGKTKLEIEAEFGPAFRVEGPLYRYDPSLLYGFIYSDTINVRYDDNLKARDISCAET